MAEGIAAQDRGEVSSGGNPTVVSPDGCQATAADLGVRRDEMHEARAIRRAGELINQIKAAKTGPKPELGAGARPQLGKRDAARDAGMSPPAGKDGAARRERARSGIRGTHIARPDRGDMLMANERGDRFRSLAEIGHVPPRLPTIAGMLAPGEIALLTGAPKSGKSTLAAGLAASVSRGGPFLGRPCAPGPVIYLAAERGGGITRRLRAAGADEAATFVAEWSPLLIEEADLIIDGIRVATEAPALIVLDTLARCLAGADENSSRDMGLAIAALATIQAAFPSSAVVVIHHVGKTSSTARGSNALVAGCDMELSVAKHAGGLALRLDCSNHQEAGETLPFRFEASEGDDGPELVAVADGRTASDRGDPLEKGRAKRTSAKEKIVAQMDRILPDPLPNDPDERRELATEAAKEIGRITPDMKANSVRKAAMRLLDDVLNRRSQEASQNAS